jgi:hypothetical protein
MVLDAVAATVPTALFRRRIGVDMVAMSAEIHRIGQTERLVVVWTVTSAAIPKTIGSVRCVGHAARNQSGQTEQHVVWAQRVINVKTQPLIGLAPGLQSVVVSRAGKGARFVFWVAHAPPAAARRDSSPLTVANLSCKQTLDVSLPVVVVGCYDYMERKPNVGAFQLGQLDPKTGLSLKPREHSWDAADFASSSCIQQ